MGTWQYPRPQNESRAKEAIVRLVVWPKEAKTQASLISSGHQEVFKFYCHVSPTMPDDSTIKQPVVKVRSGAIYC